MVMRELKGGGINAKKPQKQSSIFLGGQSCCDYSSELSYSQFVLSALFLIWEVWYLSCGFLVKTKIKIVMHKFNQLKPFLQCPILRGHFINGNTEH